MSTDSLQENNTDNDNVVQSGKSGNIAKCICQQPVILTEKHS